MSKPDWVRDELILALDLYFREPAARGSKSHPGVLELSKVLNLLPIHAKHAQEEDFRNPNGVGMKLSNFLRFDPTYEGKGLKRGSHLEEEVWNTFSEDHDRLREVSYAIRGAMKTGEANQANDAEQTGAEAPEGKIMTRMHTVRERNRTLVAKKKQEVLTTTGRLGCEVCGFDFNQFYGQHGSGYAECHHTKPISKLSPGERTSTIDLSIVCANCHRMLHSGSQWLSILELRSLIQRSI